ncbi:aspartic peptidase domain-containing protein [Mycena leptocephala]|nr:aspartic peptidase domain-containing protein [Mycena leptocephala]
MVSFALAILLLSAGVHRSFSLAVQRTRLPFRARSQPTGATLEAISNVAVTKTANRVDFRYATNITVNGQTLKVLIDTGSSDIWVVPREPLTFQNTGIFINDGFTASSVNGTIGFATVQLGSYTVQNQVFNNATAVSTTEVLEAGLDGLIGLSFAGTGPSPIQNTLQENGMDPNLGLPFLFNVFDQTPNQNNFIGISLSRTDDLEGSAEASLTINEVDPTYEAVAKSPVLPLFPGNNGVWSILMDGMTVGGVNIPLPPSQAGAPPGKLVATMDTGTPNAAISPQWADAVYSTIPGAQVQFVEVFGAKTWTIPCNTTTIVALQFGGQSFPIHPLDLTDVTVDKSTNTPICFSPFFAGSVNPEEDLLFGDSFMRNFYSIFSFGGSGIPPSMQLLSQTDSTKAATDVLNVRMALLATLAKGQPAGGSTPPSTGSPDGSTRKNSGRSHSSNLHAYAAIVVGLFAGALL